MGTCQSLNYPKQQKYLTDDVLQSVLWYRVALSEEPKHGDDLIVRVNKSRHLVRYFSWNGIITRNGICEFTLQVSHPCNTYYCIPYAENSVESTGNELAGKVVQLTVPPNIKECHLLKLNTRNLAIEREVIIQKQPTWKPGEKACLAFGLSGLLRHNADPAYVKAIISIYPESLAVAEQEDPIYGCLGGRLPLHVAVSLVDLNFNLIDTILDSYSKAASVQDDAGGLPLHILVGNTHISGLKSQSYVKRKLDNLVTKLLDLYPAATDVCDEKGRLPIHLSATTTIGCSTLLQRFPEGLLKSDKEGCLPLHLALKEASYQGSFNVYENYCESQFCHEVINERSIPYHISLDRPMDASSRELMLSDHIIELIGLHPCSVRKADNKGNLPLHLAARYKSCHCLINAQPPSFVTKVLELYPDALWERNKQGQLPLHLAAASGASASVSKLFLQHANGRYSETAMAQDFEKRNALFHASENDAPLEIIMLLLEHSMPLFQTK